MWKWPVMSREEDEPVDVFRLSTVRKATELLARLAQTVKDQRTVIELHELRMELAQYRIKSLEGEVERLRKELEGK